MFYNLLIYRRSTNFNRYTISREIYIYISDIVENNKKNQLRSKNFFNK